MQKDKFLNNSEELRFKQFSFRKDHSKAIAKTNQKSSKNKSQQTEPPLYMNNNE